MSTEVAPDPVVTASGDPGTADGSPPEGTARAQETNEGSTKPEGAEPEGTENTEKDSGSQELARLQAAAEKNNEELTFLRSVVDNINADPEILKFIHERVNGGKQADPIEEASRMFEGLDKDSENPGAWKRTMEKALRAAAEAGAKQALSEISGDLGELKKAVSGNLVETALQELGVDRGTIKSREFKALYSEMKADGAFPVGMKAAAKAKAIHNAWKLTSEGRAANQADRQRIERVKGANHLNGTSPRASATAPKQFLYDPQDPQLLSKRAEWMAANPGASPSSFVNIRKRQAPK